MYKHIFWDFDGTLFDTYPTLTLAFKRALEDDGINEDRDKIMSLMKVSEATAMDYYKSKFNISSNLKERYDRYRKETDIKTVKPFPNVENVCRSIYESGRFNYLYTHRGSSSFDYLKACNLYGYFTDFITKENNFKRKPDPEALLFMLKKYNINPEEAIMVGDRDIDLLAAKNANIKACFFDYDNTNICEFADYKINQMEQLLLIL